MRKYQAKVVCSSRTLPKVLVSADPSPGLAMVCSDPWDQVGTVDSLVSLGSV